MSEQMQSGWNRSTSQNGTNVPARGTGKSRVLGIVVAAVVIVGAIVAWVFCASSESVKKDQSQKDKKPAPIKEVNPAVGTKPRAMTNAVKKAVEPEKPAYVKKPGQMQLPNGKILTFPPPKEGETRKIYAHGHMYECDHLGNFKELVQRQLFHTAFEQNFLGLAQEGKPYIPAFITGLDEAEVRKMLEKNYTMKGDETEEEIAALKAYDEMRCAALSYMEEGGKFDDFVKEYATFDKKQRAAKANSMREVMTLYKQGKIAEAKLMYKAANVMLEQKGYKPLSFPAHIQQAFDSVPEE